MSEIEKMYENAGVELTEGLEWVCKNPDHCIGQNLSVVPENCTGCEHFKREMRYPPFTPDKQIELIKWLAGFWLHINDVDGQINISTGDGYISYCAENLTDAIALCINSKWNNLTEEEKQQVKGILE